MGFSLVSADGKIQDYANIGAHRVVLEGMWFGAVHYVNANPNKFKGIPGLINTPKKDMAESINGWMQGQQPKIQAAGRPMEDIMKAHLSGAGAQPGMSL